jgi:cephalosporin hydroxylase
MIARMAEDPEVETLKRRLFDKSIDYRYSYNFTWLGRPIIQYPEDIVALQEVIWKVQPDLIVETGIAHGGSLIFSASLLKLMGGRRRVLGVDIDIRSHNRAAIEAHPLADHIAMIEGSSIDDSTVETIFRFAREFVRPLVILDSNHTHEHVLAELRAYSPLVQAGSYLIVMDTVVEYVAWEYPDRDWGRGDNPLTATRAFLDENRRFEIDEEYDRKLLMSVAPSGFLRCTESITP